MKISTVDECGRRVVVDYEVHKVEEEAAPEIAKIECYSQFKRYLQKAAELREYHGGAEQARKYDAALSDLLRRDAAAYQRYTDKLNEELTESHNKR